MFDLNYHTFEHAKQRRNTINNLSTFLNYVANGTSCSSVMFSTKRGR